MTGPLRHLDGDTRPAERPAPPSDHVPASPACRSWPWASIAILAAGALAAAVVLFH